MDLRSITEFKLLGSGRNDTQAHVVRRQSILHDLLQRLEHELLSIGQRHVRLIVFLQLLHGSITTAADSARLPLEVGTRRVGLEQRRALLVVDAGNEQSDTVRATHGLLLAAFIALAEVHGNITDGLRDETDGQRLLVVESVILSFHAGMIDKDSSVTDDTAHGARAVAVDLDELLRLLRLHELGHEFLLDAEDDTLRGLDTDGSATVL